MYSTLDQACQVCIKQKKPTLCIKRWGPGKEALEPSRPIPTAMDEVLESEDVMLLEWFYLNRHTRHAALDFGTWYIQLSNFSNETRKIYKSSITCLSLRYALLTYSGFMSSGNRMGSRELCNATLARTALLKNRPDTWSEGDLFASSLLACVASWNKDALKGEHKVHIDGFTMILKHISGRNNGPKLSNLLVFLPIARDWLLQFCSLLTPREYVQCYSCCREVLGPATIQQWYLIFRDRFWAVFRALVYFGGILSKAVSRMLTCDMRVGDSSVVQMVQDVKAELENLDLETFLRDAKETTVHLLQMRVEYQICILLVALLNGPDIVENFTDPHAIDASLSLFQMISAVVHLQLATGEEILYLCRWTWFRALCLALAGLPRDVAVQSLSIAPRKHFCLYSADLI